MVIQSRKEFLTRKFKKYFDQAPTVWVQAPGRVDLMGSHTDYNEGFVLTQAIDRHTWIAARPRSDKLVRLRSLNLSGYSEFHLDEIPVDTAVPWSNYVRGVAVMLQEKGATLCGFDGLIHSTIPFGSGLSSSAALEVATAVLFNTISALKYDPLLLALLCQRAENEFVGMNCGILDQYTSTMGQENSALLLDCRHLTSRSVAIAPGITIVIGDTRARRELVGSEYSQRRAQCETGARILASFYPQVQTLRDVSRTQFEAHRADLPDVVARRCQFVIEENARVMAMADALAQGDYQKIAALSSASFAGAHDLYEISCSEMDQMMAAMLGGPGIIGGRQAGAGFGGCMVAFVKAEQVTPFINHVWGKYYQLTGIKPDIFPVRAAPGAGIIGLEENSRAC